MVTQGVKYLLIVLIFLLCLSPAYAIDEKVDKELKTIWCDMKSALINKNIEKAIEYYHAETKENYRDIYTAFGDKLPEILLHTLYKQDTGHDTNITQGYVDD
jgi:hypothetical protein